MTGFMSMEGNTMYEQTWYNNKCDIMNSYNNIFATKQIK